MKNGNPLIVGIMLIFVLLYFDNSFEFLSEKWNTYLYNVGLVLILIYLTFKFKKG